MDAAARADLTPELWGRLLARLGAVEVAPLKGAMENWVFSCRPLAAAGGDGDGDGDGGDDTFVVRVSHPKHRTRGQVLAELEWVRFATRGGVPAVAFLSADPARRPMELERDDLESLGPFVAAEPLPGGRGDLLAVVMRRARGRKVAHAHVPAGAAHAPDTSLYEAWGEALGLMHSLAARFRPLAPRRGTHAEWLGGFLDFAERTDPEVAARFREHLAWLEALPADEPGSAGLCHADAHTGNFFVDYEAAAREGTGVRLRHLTLIDFDGMSRRHWASDLAVPMTDHMWFQNDDTARPREAFQTFCASFLAGYERHASLAPEWRARLERFMLLRSVLVYLFLKATGDPKWAALNDPARDDILAGTPFLDWAMLRRFYERRESFLHLFT